MNMEDNPSGLRSSKDKEFPSGMSVLVVDDDPTCLKVLENLLRSCDYNVTTTNKATKALEMLRKNKNKYDLIISDVNMPDMDGFRLLELVGLEMNLPVIMISAHSDTKLVKKGITHGACDYLLKPARIEELKNIWQHVIRKKRDQNNKSVEDSSSGSGEQNSKVDKKRKEQEEYNHQEEGEESNGDDSDDPSAIKKPRVVWSAELHSQFIEAVNDLGYSKAVPKKILERMNIPWLTRENVASHLQKFRHYLKKMSIEAQQAVSTTNMVVGFGSKDLGYLRNINSLHRFESLPSSATLSNTILPPYPNTVTSTFGALNSIGHLTSPGITCSSRLIQPNQILTNSRNNAHLLVPSNNNNMMLQSQGRPHNNMAPLNAQPFGLGLGLGGGVGGSSYTNPFMNNNTRDVVSSTSSFIANNNSFSFPCSSSSGLAAPVGNPTGNIQSNINSGLIGNNTYAAAKQGWDQHAGQDGICNPIQSLGVVNNVSSVHDMPLIGELNSGNRPVEYEGRDFDNDWEHIMNTVMRQDQNEPSLIDGEFNPF